MRLAYVLICSALMIAFFVGLRAFLDGVSEGFSDGLVIGLGIGFFAGMIAMHFQRKRHAPHVSFFSMNPDD